MARRRAVALLFLFLAAAYPALLSTAKQAQRTPKKAPVAQQSNKVRAAVSGERALAQRWLQNLSLRDKIAQLVVITSYGEAPSSRSSIYRDYVRAVRDLKVGGMIVVNRIVGGSVRNAEPYAMAAFLNRMQRLAQVPLIVGGDFERGASMRVSGTIKYPHLMTYGAAGDLDLTRGLGLATAREARALGVHWVFAPVADVNNNPDNPIINIRSFGENPVDVAKQVRAFIEGAHSDPASRVLVTVKHFPGHGDTATDSHIGLAQLTADKARMDTTELVPFREAIRANVDAVMTAHMAVPAYEAEEIPATVSPKVLTGLLRDDLNFKGLVVTDAMDMQGLAKQFSPGEAAVRALEAGADVLLMPPNPEVAIKAVQSAVNEGRLSARRIHESAQRVLMAKARVGLDKKKLVDLEAISEVIESTEAEQQAQLAADRGVALVKNENGLLPISEPAGACAWVLTENRYGQQGRRFAEEIRSRTPAMRLQLLDPELSPVEAEELIEKAGGCNTHIVAAFVSVAAYRGDTALRGNYPAFVRSLIAQQKPIALISLGSPYLLRSFPGVSAYLSTFSPAPSTETAAAKAILGVIGITGRLPVSIPDIAKYGDSIQLPKQ
jgi:beta-N-acetylhexosaminidase